jgi:hypothetical protein
MGTQASHMGMMHAGPESTSHRNDASFSLHPSDPLSICLYVVITMHQNEFHLYCSAIGMLVVKEKVTLIRTDLI